VSTGGREAGIPEDMILPEIVGQLKHLAPLAGKLSVVHDTSDASVPREIAYYISADPGKWTFNNATGDLFRGPNTATIEDMRVDERGSIFKHVPYQGLFASRCTV
jgi:hypothetical protein